MKTRLLIVLTATLLMAGCGPTVVPGTKVLFRHTRPRHRKLTYRGTYEIREQGPTSTAHEETTKNISIGHLVKEDGWDKLYFQVRDISRYRIRRQKGKRTYETEELQYYFDWVAADPIHEKIENKTVPCSLINDRGVVKTTKKAPYNAFHPLSAFYLLPTFPEHEVEVLKSWQDTIPVMAYNEKGHRTDFKLRITYTFAGEITEQGIPCYLIRYIYQGRFNSSERPDDYPEDWRKKNEFIHKTAGEGEIYFAKQGYVVTHVSTATWLAVKKWLAQLPESEDTPVQALPEFDWFKEESKKRYRFSLSLYRPR